MSVFSDLADRIKTFVKDSIKLKSLSKEDILAIVEQNITAHKHFITPLESLTKKEITDLISNYRKISSGLKEPYYHILTELNKLNGVKANNLVLQEHELAPIFKTNKKFIAILTQIKADIDKIIVDEELTLFSTRLSHAALLGILRQSNLYGTYSSFLLSVMIRTQTKSNYTLPGYRAKYLEKHLVDIATITNLITDKTGTYRFLSEVEDMRKRDANTLLYANDNTFDIVTRASNMTMSAVHNIRFGISLLDIFTWGMTIIDDYNHECHLRNERHKKWMEAHVALLKMDLANTNIDDPKYVKLTKIIDAYDAEISKYDKKINKYLGE